MQPPTRDQSDIGLVNVTVDASDGATIELPNGELLENTDRARQEFKDEADINYMLSRFGITAPRGAPTYGEWDDTIDLMTAITAVQEAREGYRKLPSELRDKFPSMEAFLAAVDNGSLVLKSEDPPAPAPAQPPPA